MSQSDRISRPMCFGTYRKVGDSVACSGCSCAASCIAQEGRLEAQLHAYEAAQAEAQAEAGALKPASQDGREYTGGSVSYYRTHINAPLSGGAAYTAECNDIIEALGMNYAEGNAFKAIWRSCAARTLGLSKRGYTDGLYDAEKVVFFGGRMVAIRAQELEQ